MHAAPHDIRRQYELVLTPLPRVPWTHLKALRSNDDNMLNRATQLLVMQALALGLPIPLTTFAPPWSRIGFEMTECEAMPNIRLPTETPLMLPATDDLTPLAALLYVVTATVVTNNVANSSNTPTTSETRSTLEVHLLLGYILPTNAPQVLVKLLLGQVRAGPSPLPVQLKRASPVRSLFLTMLLSQLTVTPFNLTKLKLLPQLESSLDPVLWNLM